MNKIPMNLLEGWDIVVVEDEADSLEVATIILESYGAVVHAAENGKVGLDVIRGVHPRFVMCDISMPVLDGWGMMYHMLEDESIKFIPVIALTAHAMPGDAQRALDAGFTNYLTKPLTVETMMENLVNLLRQIPSLAGMLNI